MGFPAPGNKTDNSPFAYVTQVRKVNERLKGFLYDKEDFNVRNHGMSGQLGRVRR